MIKCDFCDKPGPGSKINLAPGWICVSSDKLGDLYACPDCDKKRNEMAAPSPQFFNDYEDKSDIDVPLSMDIATKDRLRLYVSKIENLIGERTEINDAIRKVKADAKALGFDTKALMKVINRRGKDPRALKEEEAMLDLYLHALGEI